MKKYNFKHLKAIVNCLKPVQTKGLNTKICGASKKKNKQQYEQLCLKGLIPGA